MEEDEEEADEDKGVDVVAGVGEGDCLFLPISLLSSIAERLSG